MKQTRLILTALIALLSTPLQASGAGQPDVWSMDAGQLTFQYFPQIIDALDLALPDAKQIRDEQVLARPVGSGMGAIEFQAPAGHFGGLLGGSLTLPEGLGLVVAGKSRQSFRLVPLPGHPPALAVVDAEGGHWLHLTYGHFGVRGDELQVRVMDVRVGEALALAVGQPGVEGLMLGTADLDASINRPSPLRIEDVAKGICPAAPVWPPTAGDVDIRLMDMDRVDFIAILDGRVSVAPSAYFENRGDGDAPWFAMFTTVSSEDCCLDSGDGVNCEPYSNDQGGLLVWNFYRLADGRLEQLGRSDVKHAFNSINTDSVAGERPCRVPNNSAGGRIAWSGCEDLYSSGTNANRDFLGPRSEIDAFPVIWKRSGSIFDANGDDACDHPSSPFFGGRRCQAPAADVLDRRLHVAESDLTTPGARYFVEAWYLARDDVNIFNSMGFQEVTPSEVLVDVWRFDCGGIQGNCGNTFQPGPVIDALFPLGVEETRSSVRVDTGEGRYQLVSNVVAVGDGYRYDYVLVNFDFDRQLRRLSVPVPAGATPTALTFVDGDDLSGNDWVPAVIGMTEVAWTTPGAFGLDWGSAYTFSFESAFPPIAGDVGLEILESGDPMVTTIQGIVPNDDVIHLDGFED